MQHKQHFINIWIKSFHGNISTSSLFYLLIYLLFFLSPITSHYLSVGSLYTVKTVYTASSDFSGFERSECLKNEIFLFQGLKLSY